MSAWQSSDVRVEPVACRSPSKVAILRFSTLITLSALATPSATLPSLRRAAMSSSRSAALRRASANRSALVRLGCAGSRVSEPLWGWLGAACRSSPSGFTV